MDGLGIEAIARFFTDFGYEQRDELAFPAKKLRALWFSPPPCSADTNLPRIFVSELKVHASTVCLALHPCRGASHPAWNPGELHFARMPFSILTSPPYAECFGRAASPALYSLSTIGRWGSCRRRRSG